MAKTDKTRRPQIVFRVSDARLAQIDDECQKLDRTRTEVIMRALDMYFEKVEPKPKKPS